MTFTVIAGPCCLDGGDTLQQVAEVVKEYPQTYLKGGAYKPLTWGPTHYNRRPYQKQLGRKGIQLLADIGSIYQLPTVSEMLEYDELELSMITMTQIGARNQQNFGLLETINKQAWSGKPILLKRHFGCSLEELYASTTYLPNCDVWVCERGIIAPHCHDYRYLLDYQAILAWKHLHPEIPLLVDCSHWIGRDAAHLMGQNMVYEDVSKAALASKALGADGIYVDVHPDPARAWVDPFQALTLDHFRRLMERLKYFPVSK